MCKRIGVIGLGKVGICMASVFSERYKTVGLDTDRKRLNEIRSKKVKIERGVKLGFPVTTSYNTIKKADIIFIIVPTPSLPNGNFSDRHIAEVLNNLNNYKGIIVLCSTVSPFTCKKYPRIDIYNPAFIALGNVVDSFKKPDYVLIGCDTDKGKILEEVYRNLGIGTFRHTTRLEAEIIKLATNCCVTTKITMANVIAEVCDDLKVDIDKILEAVGTDSRIGNKFFRSGLPYGGPCFPRDNRAFVAFSDKTNKPCELFLTVDQVNNAQVLRWVSKACKTGAKKIGFETLSYKEGTDIEDESALKKIYLELKRFGRKCVIGRGDITFNHWGIIH